jgi:hypothetical protein
MKMEINNAEETLLAAHQALDNELEAKISSIRAEYKAKKENLNEKSRLDTQGVRLKLEDTEKRLELEQEFVSDFRKIPNEIVVEILQWHLQDQTPPRTLALVCKAWKALLLHTPSFWRTLHAYLVYPNSLEREVDALSKRIALSRSTLLDITLSWGDGYNDFFFYDDGDEYYKMDLFKLVAETGIKRWRSLKLQCISGWCWPTSQLSLEGIFHGTASSLQKLELPLELDPFSSIYRIILQSTRIKEVTFTGAAPSVFQGSTIFQNVAKVTASATVFQQIAPFNNLQELCITDWDRNSQCASLPPLAVHTELHGSVTRWQLHSLQWQNVVSLHLRTITNTEFDTIVDFPELINLSISNDGIAALERISAPKLANLSLALERTDTRTRKLEISRTMDIVRNKPQNIMIRPTSLTMALPVSTTAVLAILQLWPQLQHLELTYGNEFSWKGAFPNSLTRKNNPLCLELVTLRLQTHSGIFGKRWEEIAKSILAIRKDLPLNKIEWRYVGEAWRRLTVSN